MDGQERKQLHSALIDAFPTATSLEQMLMFGLDKELRAIVGEGSLQDIVFKLIQAADSQGWIKDLVRVARDSNPGNQLLKATAEELLPNRDPEANSSERVLKLRVHRARFTKSPAEYYFINATNLSLNRPIELTHVWYEDKNFYLPIHQHFRPLPVRLEADQSWEIWIEVEKIPQASRDTIYQNFRARISTGTIFSSEANPDIPLFGKVPGGPIPEILMPGAAEQQKILVLAAIPHGLRLDEEIRRIREAIKRATRRDLFKIEVRTAVRPPDIRQAIAEEKPKIVHFCGHGMKDGSLLLEDDGGSNKPVSPKALASLFRLHADYVKCVLLNACYSEEPAVTISQYINYVIGMNSQIQDRAAIAFAQGFYDGLGYITLDDHNVFQRAFDEGMVAIEMEALSQGTIPVLKIREDG